MVKYCIACLGVLFQDYVYNCTYNCGSLEALVVIMFPYLFRKLNVFSFYEKIFLFLFRFFIECNNRLFKVLYELASREDRNLTAEAVHEMGLDPTGDRLFISQIVDHYSINIVLPDVTCC